LAPTVHGFRGTVEVVVVVVDVLVVVVEVLVISARLKRLKLEKCGSQ